MIVHEFSTEWYFAKHTFLWSGTLQLLHQKEVCFLLHCWHIIWRCLYLEPWIAGSLARKLKCEVLPIDLCEVLPEKLFKCTLFPFLTVFNIVVGELGKGASTSGLFLHPITSHSAARDRALLLRNWTWTNWSGSLASVRLTQYSTQELTIADSKIKRTLGSKTFLFLTQFWDEPDTDKRCPQLP